MADLDDLLEDIEIEQEEGETSACVPNTPRYIDWKKSTVNVPEDTQNRWSSFMVKDINAKMESSLQCSDLYRSWDGQPPTHQSVGKILQDAVRGASMKCGFEEKKATALLSITNVLEPGPGRALQTAYSRQILKDLKRIYKNDPNMNESLFPSLAISING